MAGGATLSVPAATSRKIYVDVDYFDSDAAGGTATLTGLLTASDTLVTGRMTTIRSTSGRRRARR